MTTLSRHSVGTYQGNEPTRNFSGNTRPQSSQLAEPLWTEPFQKCRIGVRELNPTSKKKKALAGNESSNLPHKSSQAKKTAITIIILIEIYKKNTSIHIPVTQRLDFCDYSNNRLTASEKSVRKVFTCSSHITSK